MIPSATGPNLVEMGSESPLDDLARMSPAKFLLNGSTVDKVTFRDMRAKYWL